MFGTATLQATSIAGIPIPSTSPLFLAVLAGHVVAALIAVTAGLVAMLATKRRGTHPRFGTVYYCALAGVAGTMAVLAATRWTEDRVLFGLGVVAFVAATVGRAAMRYRWTGCVRIHITGMGTSYMVMLIAFYVDNGAHLPLWRLLPASAYWLLPLVIGTPLIGRSLWFHPLVRPMSRARR